MYRATPADGVAWITGASSGIGRQVAIEMAARGFTVVASARRRAELQALADEGAARRLPGRIVVHAVDAVDPVQMAETVATIIAEHGAVALAFLNVGTNFHTPGNPFDAGTGWRTFEANVRSVMNGLDPVLAHMRGRGRGQLAVNASLAGWIGIPGSGYYGASKAALIHLCETLRGTEGRSGITIQVVTPGFVATPLVAGNRHPMPLMLDVETAARRIVDGFERGGFAIAFPWPLTVLLKFLRLLPYWLYFPIVAIVLGNRVRPDDPSW